MGRPRKTTDKRTAPVLVKFTEAEKAALVSAVARYGVPSLAEYVRQQALKGRVQVFERAELSGPDRAALQRVGVNLNQIARHLNEKGGELPAIDGLAAELRAVLAQLNSLLLAGGGE